MPALDRKPRLYEDLRLVWDAFIDLRSSRQNDMAASAIPVSEIAAWMDVFGLRDSEQRMMFYKLVRALDCRLMAWRSKRVGNTPSRD